MPSPNLVAASQSERTEAQQRERVTWAQLQALAATANATKKAFFAHKKAVDAGEIDVTFDLEDMALLREQTAAAIAYQSALKRYQEQQS